MKSFLVADDHEITRVGIISSIKAEFEDAFIGQAGNGEDLFEQLKLREYDMLITDMGMPDTDAYRLIDTALLIQPNLRILVISMNKEDLYAANYLKKGALGYIEKASGFSEIAAAIRVVLSGDIYMSPNLKKMMISGKSQTLSNPFLRLSQRELEICQMLCEGKGLTEIATHLHLGVSTIGTHKTRIMDKTGAANLVELMKMAQLNLIF